MKIVGIGGYPRSGKDSLGEAFIKAGYYGVSFGEIVREHARKRHNDKADPISLQNMTETSNWLREQYGADVLLQEALRQYKEKIEAGEEYAGLLFISIRAPIEVDFILEKNGQLIWVEASDEVRHMRNNQHLRKGEVPLRLEEFVRQEQLQARPQPGTSEAIQMNMEYVKSKATTTIKNNDDDFNAFRHKAKELVTKIS
jgi:dephospho-CoA kinase